MDDPVSRLLAAIETGTPLPAELYSPDAVLDATVPNWRITRRDGTSVSAELSGWYRDPGHFEVLSRTPLPTGELVEFTLTWEEGGVPHACHQAHVLRVEDGRISRHTVWCGGRWPASLLAEMGEAERAAV